MCDAIQCIISSAVFQGKKVICSSGSRVQVVECSVSSEVFRYTTDLCSSGHSAVHFRVQCSSEQCCAEHLMHLIVECNTVVCGAIVILLNKGKNLLR